MRYYKGFKYLEDDRGLHRPKTFAILPSESKLFPKSGRECKEVIDQFWNDLNEFLQFYGVRYEFSGDHFHPHIVVIASEEEATEEEATEEEEEGVALEEALPENPAPIKMRSKKEPNWGRRIVL